MAYAFNPQIIAQFLTGLGGAASAYGAGSPQWGYAGAQAVNAQQEQQRQAAQDRLRDEMLRTQLQQQQQAMTDAANQKAAAQKAFGSLLPGQSPIGVRNQSTGAFDTSPSGAPGALDSLPPAVASYIKTRGAYDPAGAVDFYGQYTTQAPAAPITNGGMQYDPSTKTWSQIPGYLEEKKAEADATRAPVQPPQPSADFITWTLLKKQDPSTPGYTEWKRSMSGGVPTYTTVYGPGGAMKSFAAGDAAIAPLLAQGWTTSKPDKPNTDLVSLAKDGQVKTITRDDPQFGMYLGSGWVESSAAPKPETKTDLEKRALDAGLTPGTDEYKQFMATGGKVPEGPGGTYGGTAIDAQDSNIILKGQTDEAYRATPEYALAWNRQYQQPKIQSVQDPNDPTRTTLVSVTPIVPAGLKPPTGAATGAASPQPAATNNPPPAVSGAVPPSQPAVPTATPIPGTSSQKQLNGEQSLSKGFADRMLSADAIITKFAQAGTSVKQTALDGLPGGNFMISDERQQLDQAAQNFINAQLRRESGAAISASELATARKQYIPQPGDSDALLKQKAANRAEVIRGMQQNASPYPLPAAKPTNADLKKKFGINPVNP